MTTVTIITNCDDHLQISPGLGSSHSLAETYTGLNTILTMMTTIMVSTMMVKPCANEMAMKIFMIVFTSSSKNQTITSSSDAVDQPSFPDLPD